MLSRISKMSVLGIVALMLVLGLTASDALAQAAGTNNIEVASTPDTLRAAGTGNIVFTLNVTGRESNIGSPPKSTPVDTVTISIPTEWVITPKNPNANTDFTEAADVDSATVEPGEIQFAFDADTGQDQSGRDVGVVRGRNLIITLAEGTAGNGSYTITYYKATAPHRRGSYKFPVGNANYADVNDDQNVGEFVTVDWAASGSGTVTLPSHASKLQKDVKITGTDTNHPYNGKYVMVADEGLGDVRLVYEAVGSMPKAATVKVTMVGFAFAADRPDDDTTASVSGSGSPKPTRTTTEVTATVDAEGGLQKGNKITIILKTLKAPPVPSAAITTGYTFTVASHTGQDGDTEENVGDGVFEFYTTSKHGSGTLAFSSATAATDDTDIGDVTDMPVVAGTDLGTLTFTIGGNAGVGPDSKYSIQLPSMGWHAPTKAIGQVGGDTNAELNGHTNAPAFDRNARTLSGTLTGTITPYAPTNPLTVTYKAGKVLEQGRHYFDLATNSGPHIRPAGTLTDVRPDGYPKFIDVTAEHKNGSFVVKSNNVALVQAAPKDNYPVLELVYTANGYMPKGIVMFTVPWDSPRHDSGGTTPEKGAVSFSGKANFVINSNGTITATQNAVWDKGDEIKVIYKNVTVPDTDPAVEYTFAARAVSYGTLGDNGHNHEHKVGPNRAGDGSGAIAIEPSTANASSAVNLTLTYTAEGTMAVGAVVKVTSPPDWPDFTAAGTSVSIGTDGIAASLAPPEARTLTATSVVGLNKDSKIVFNINGVTTPAVGKQYQFTAESRAHPTQGGLQSLTRGPATITISERAAGSVTLTKSDDSPLSSALPNQQFEALKIKFMAGATMQSGAEVRVTVPEGWMRRPFEDNDMPRTSGEVTLEGKADLDVQGDELVAKLNAQINSGETVTFTYHMPMAPADETASSEFTTMSSIVEGGGLLRVGTQSTNVVVRNVVTTLTLTADSATSVFVDESVTLTVASDARAPVGGLTVALAADTGMFSLTEDGAAVNTVTIADLPDSMSTTLYYIAPSFIDMESVDVMLTATYSVDDVDIIISDPVTVEVRSTISRLQVNGMDDPEPVEVGTTIMVTAIGDDADGSVTVTDADGAEVEGLVDLGLDPDASATDVPAGNVGHMREINLPDDLPEGMYTVTLTIDGEPRSINITVVAARAAVAELTLTASEKNFFAGGPITVTVAADARAPVGGLKVTLSTNPADSGMFSMTKGGDAVKMVTIPDSAETMSAMVYYTNAASGAVTLMAAAGDDLSDSVDVMVNPTITVQVNGMDAPEGVQAGDTLAVTAMGKTGGGTVSVLDAAGDPVGALTGLGLNIDADAADAADVPEGSVAYMISLTLPDDLADGTYTVTVTIGSESDSVQIIIKTPLTEPDHIDIAANPTSVFVGAEVSLTITLMSGGEAANAVSDMVVTLTSDSETAVLAESVTIAAGMNSAEATFSDMSDGMVTITATSDVTNGVIVDDVIVKVKPTIINYQINGMDDPGPLTAGVTLTITATGKEGKATVMVTNSAGDAVVPAKGLTGLDEEPDEEGNIAYTRDVDLPADLADGRYIVTVAIAGLTDDIEIEVIDDQSAPALSNQKVLPDVVASGSVLTLSVDVSSNVPNPKLSVMADVSEIDADAAAVQLMKLPGSESTYASIYVVQNSDPADDGMKTITFKATDRIDGMSEMTATTSLKNDVTPPVLSDAAAMPSPVVNGMDVTISVNGGESGLTVTADASAIGGDAAADLTEGMDENMAGTGMYSSMPITVAVSAGGDYTVAIKAVDGSGNEAAMDVTVTVEVHEVTSVTFAPAKVSTNEEVMVTAMGSAGLTAMFNVFDADGRKIVDGKSMDESDVDGTYMGSFKVVVDMHPAGEYWVSASIGTSDAMTADGSLTIDHEKHFTLSIGAGTHAIHIPLDVDGIDSVGDVYDMLGDAVNFIITFIDGNPVSYLGDESAGSMADAAIGDDTGLIAVMRSATTLELTGQALGTGGTSSISIAVGNNLVGVPLDPVVDMMISDALVAGVEAIAVSNAAGDDFHTITAAGDEGDGPLMGGVGYIIVASAAGSIPIVGTAWENDGAVSAAPGIAFSGSQTPVLYVEGGVMDEFGMLSQIPEISVTVKNLSTGASLDTVFGTEESAAAYSGTFVEFSRHAAKAGDVLEITAHSPSPFVGVRPVPQIVVSAEEVLTSRISLPDLELYEIPSETELLANYPNPFNPETWIPYRLAKAAEVTLSIYDTNGALVRSIDVGFKPAAVYESRASAIYWDGRNNYGERVASGTYFYHLTAGEDYASTRRMVILK